jgi:ribosomal protein S8
MVRKFIVNVPYSEMNKDILTILLNEGYILGFKKLNNSQFEIKLDTRTDNRWLAQLRIYQDEVEGKDGLSYPDLKKKTSQCAFAIVTNSVGLMPLDHALTKAIGGKLIVSF